ncbi:exported hypothetical protein [Hyphomicrobiales bacterium]|jgi:hypothetical protein|nr:exported hypothetical protein [Hyphomicrobiales bacterium]CAH1702511.1 conserved exported hypothetical protein [Hyphomicrobiales bacterium]CAI0346712.1 exported hypothetical protein [Hyphomicrobiales bacterium]
MRNLLLSSMTLSALLVLSAEAQARCIYFYNRGGYSVAQNHCSRTVTIRWTDSNRCSSGCAARLGGGSEQTVMAPEGQYSYRETDG